MENSAFIMGYTQAIFTTEYMYHRMDKENKAPWKNIPHPCKSCLHGSEKQTGS